MTQRKFPPHDLTGFDQMQAEAIEDIRNSDSFIAIVFDNTERASRVTHAIAKADLPYAVAHLHLLGRNLIDQMTQEQVLIMMAQLASELEEDLGL